MSQNASLHIGTSGWHYHHWKGPFYPGKLPDRSFLGYYKDYFETAEINSTFYRMPPRETFRQWQSAVPEDFVFAVKASRYITHMKKLKEPQQPLANFFAGIDALEDRLGPVLFQLPPGWKRNLDRLGEFIDALPQGYRYAFEFRNPDWFGKATEDVLAAKGAAFCIYHLKDILSPQPATADFVYIRLHGPAGAYAGKYDYDTLSIWAEKVSSWAEQGKDVFCYFDNDEKGYAVQNALTLKEILAGK